MYCMQGCINAKKFTHIRLSTTLYTCRAFEILPFQSFNHCPSHISYISLSKWHLLIMPPTFGPHATLLDSSHILCACPSLGCDQRSFEYGGKLYHGRLFHRKNYPKHLQAALSNPTAEGSTTSIPTQASQPATTQDASTSSPTNQSISVSALVWHTTYVPLTYSSSFLPL